jgi:hypothetical protein
MVAKDCNFNPKNKGATSSTTFNSGIYFKIFSQNYNFLRLWLQKVVILTKKSRVLLVATLFDLGMFFVFLTKNMGF